ncbi:1517_t:CDS:2, partial [Funneliformis caledonium]
MNRKQQIQNVLLLKTFLNELEEEKLEEEERTLSEEEESKICGKATVMILGFFTNSSCKYLCKDSRMMLIELVKVLAKVLVKVLVEIFVESLVKDLVEFL